MIEVSYIGDISVDYPAVDTPFEVKCIKFPDNTQKIDLDGEFLLPHNNFLITWKQYESDEELVRLIFITKHLKDRLNAKVLLYMPYIPNARMDRVKSDTEVFTLKYFCEVINSLGFEKVFVLDPHSNVSAALLNHVAVMSPENYINMAINDIEEYPTIYFPDEGAYKRYGGMDCFIGMDVLIGHKVRNWETGKIEGLNITDRDGMSYGEGHFRGESVLMIDDIISYGGTMAYSADELKRLGFDYIYAYATHTEGSVNDPEKGTFRQRLESGVIDKLYTTDSLCPFASTNKVTIFNS